MVRLKAHRTVLYRQADLRFRQVLCLSSDLGQTRQRAALLVAQLAPRQSLIFRDLGRIPANC